MSAIHRDTPTPTDLSDADLVAASETDSEAFGVLFERHVDAIHAYIVRRVGAPLAEELTAETFARAFAGRDSFVPMHTDSRPWLFGIATNVVHNSRRAEQRQLAAYKRAGSISVGMPSEFEQADARVDALNVAARLVDALLALETGDRDGLLLFAWQELSYQEVGIALGIPVGTVASRINRARGRLRNDVGRLR